MKKLLGVVFLIPTLVQAATNDDIDISLYDPTVSSFSKRDSSDAFAMFDEVRLRAAAAYVTSYQEITTARGNRERGGTKGMSIHLGVDLFSENWQAEGVLMTFPECDWGSTTVASNAFELRIYYEQALLKAVTGRLGAGIASRSFTIKTKADAAQSVNGTETTFSSGASLFVAGLDYWPSGSLSLGSEISHHIPMSSNDDPSSFDLAIRLNGHF